jgi:2'-5' RNA ligase
MPENIKSIRSFIAIELPPEIQRRLKETIISLKQNGASGVRWVDPEKIHLTLKFLGDVSLQTLNELSDTLQKNIPVQSFSICVQNLGVFPNPRRPRVIWIGISKSESLARLHNLIENICMQFGIAPEERDFSPHLTLGRISNPGSISELPKLTQALSLTPIGILGSFHPTEYILFRSDLTPQGPIYTKLKSFTLS